jgi:hypothetical protein
MIPYVANVHTGSWVSMSCTIVMNMATKQDKIHHLHVGFGGLIDNNDNKLAPFMWTISRGLNKFC